MRLIYMVAFPPQKNDILVQVLINNLRTERVDYNTILGVIIDEKSAGLLIQTMYFLR